MHDALTACSEHLLSFGGHVMAAGLKIAPEAIDAFSDAFIEQANNTLTGADLSPRLRIDAEVSLADLALVTVEAIQRLGPFGQGNPKPRLCTDWVELAGEPRCVGKGGEHLSVSFRQDGAVLRGIGFGLAAAAEDLKQHRRCRIAFEPMINEFKGRRTPEMRLLDLAFPE